MRSRFLPLFALGIPLALTAALARTASKSASIGAAMAEDYPPQSGTLSPLVPDPSLDPEKVALGRELFHDRRLSGNGTVSCASCHDLRNGGVDRLQFSRGIDGKIGDVNAPTVFNSSVSFRQFWDGRAATLEKQAEGPLLNPKEMGSSWERVAKVIAEDAEYRARFRKIYGTVVDPTRVTDAIAQFERSLVTLDSPFDRYLRGDAKAINPLQLAGYRKFQRLGCVSCHQGRGVGGNMYQTIGVVQDYFKLRGGSYPSDLGRFSVTGRDEDRHVFKVPSLRNVALTPPYFHDGSAKTLPEAIRTMAKVQLGRKLSSADVKELEAFLNALTGKIPESATVPTHREPAHADRTTQVR